mmetsp:Transcript_47851/g.77199  ORF Transcript_47851/g.77199 Transcript_47851/m.77199 type:complete len:174 (-) Transcript_47851:163-684(-)
MSVMEWRGMGIPLFAPSLNLLCRWHMRYGLVFERRVDWQSAGTRRGSLVGPHPNASAQIRRFDPNDERDEEGVRSWLAKADIYTLPHIQHFESLEELVQQLDSVDLDALSQRILASHAALQARVHAGWKRIMLSLLRIRAPGHRASEAAARNRSEGYHEAMTRLFPHLASLYV